MLGEGSSHLRQTGRHPGDGISQLGNAMPFAGCLVRLTLHHGKIHHRLSAEQVPDFLTVNVRLALLGAAMRGDDQDFGVRLSVLYQLDPLLYETLLLAFARLPHNEIDRRGGEE